LTFSKFLNNQSIDGYIPNQKQARKNKGKKNRKIIIIKTILNIMKKKTNISALKKKYYHIKEHTHMKTNLDDYITLKNVNHALLKMNAQNPISK